MVRSQKGFTIIELVVVIVILGILAAVAFPKFVNLTTDARIAAVNGIAGGLRSAVVVVQARYQATGAFTSPVSMADGTTVAVSTGATGGFPTIVLTGIGSVMGCETAIACKGIVVGIGGGAAGDMVTWRPAPGTLANCQASYAAATGIVTVDVSIC